MSLLAFIPKFLQIAGKATGLFNKAKQIKQQITSSPSMASNPEELKDEINNLPDDQKQRWAELMQIEIEKYAKENERLDLEVGRIDQNITSKLSSADAGEIAILRQTTRPWAVRMMVHFIFFPFYLAIIDIIQNIIKNWIFFWTDINPFNSLSYVFGNINLERISKIDGNLLNQIQSIFSDPQITIVGQLYLNSIPWITGIIVSYMGLREIGKFRYNEMNYSGNDISLPTKITDQIGNSIGLINRIRNLFKKKGK